MAPKPKPTEKAGKIKNNLLVTFFARERERERKKKKLIFLLQIDQFIKKALPS